MRLVICTAVAAIAGAGVAWAAPAGKGGLEAPNAPAAARDAVQAAPVKGKKILYICDTSDLTRRGFEREHGKAEFVSAAQAMTAGEAWAAPKCITEAEARRLRSERLAGLR